jgi:hypothetical protein
MTDNVSTTGYFLNTGLERSVVVVVVVLVLVLVLACRSNSSISTRPGNAGTGSNEM